jgi:leucyl-tRNA synthetase
VQFKLRDWLFSRQRYWGEPFPIILDDEGNAYSIDESELPLTLPEMADFKPTGTPEPPLSKAKDWIQYSDASGAIFTRETNTMPQWAGSCWYYLRYIDPKNPSAFVDKHKEQYWMPVDLYVGGVEHAVLHLLYARFWHKVLFDLGHVSTPEPFKRLVNQGLILGEMEYHVFENAGQLVSASEVTSVDEEATPEGVKLFGLLKSNGQKVYGRRIQEEETEKKGDSYVLKSNPQIRVDARSFKMSKSRGNVVNPDVIVKDYGADCFRLYEMYMGPLEAQKPWNTRDIVGMSRFLNAVWRNLIGEDDLVASSARIADVAIPDALDRQMHRTIKKVAEDVEGMRFNTAIAELIKLNNELTHMDKVPRPVAKNLALMLAPFAPHLAEEIWNRLDHDYSLAREPWPKFDPAKLVESNMELPVQINGKLRDKITVPAGASEEQILTTALAGEKVKPWIEGKSIKKKLYVPKKLVNIVVG